MEEKYFVARAFVSCSLREEDKPFVKYVLNILKKFRIEPFGTVGMLSAAPMNIAEHMKTNIPIADIVVIVATPRYLQQDLKTGQLSYGLPEMVHVEAGMAFMSDKPVIVFLQQGTHIGSFLPNITEYIELNGQPYDLQVKSGLINSLFGNACSIVTKKKNDQQSKEMGNFINVGLAIVGGLTLAESIFSEDRPAPKRKSPPRKRR